ncbi:MAG: monovalent cation/H(+) antiporter subunit G [Rhodobacteraceae bacterium]|nr:monovalent cation/H(+) antiporter subunit G [Paracoccaceae bacterium]
MWAEYVAGVLLVVGSFFSLMASIGLLRLNDVYMRMHAASKAGTVGSGLMLLALAVHAGELGVTTRAIAGILFFLLTAPVSAHLLARAAFVVGYRPCAQTKTDAYSDMLRGSSDK